MKSIIAERIEREIVSLLDELDTIDANEAEYNDRVDKITKLYKTLSDEQKFVLENDKVDLEQQRIDNDLTVRKEQLVNESAKNISDVDIRKEQLKLDEKRISVERDKTSNDYELRERQLMDTKEMSNAELELRYKELDNQISNVIAERDLKLKEAKQSNIANYVKTGVEIGTTAATLGFYYVWLKKGFEFEEEGTITSQVFKGLISKFKPTR